MIYVLTRRPSREPQEFLMASQDRRKVMDGRRGPWREAGPGHWTTANPEWGSAYLSPRTGTVRKFVYDVREVPLV